MIIYVIYCLSVTSARHCHVVVIFSVALGINQWKKNGTIFTITTVYGGGGNHNSFPVVTSSNRILVTAINYSCQFQNRTYN